MEDGVIELADLCSRDAELDLPRWLLGGAAGLSTLALAVRRNTALTALDIGGNYLGPSGTQ